VTDARFSPEVVFNGYVAANVAYGLGRLGLLEKLGGPSGLVLSAGPASSAEQGLLSAARRLGWIHTTAGTARLSPAGLEILKHIGYFTWAVGGYGETFRHAARGGSHRDEAEVAVGSAQVGRVFMRDQVRQALAGIPYGSVADLGCGDASRLVELCRESDQRRALGIDISPDVIALARDVTNRAGLAKRIELVQADVLDLLNQDLNIQQAGHIDLVCCFLMLHHLISSAGAEVVMQKLRVAFPSSRWFVIADTVASSTDEDLPIFTLGYELAHALMSVSLAPLDEYRRAFASAGLAIVKELPFGAPNTYLFLLSSTSA
jgi:SAM-dependent methyltransferase